MRLAVFTPWPPLPSGIAGRSAELAAALAARGWAIDVFVDEQDARLAGAIGRHDTRPPDPGEVRVQSAHDFVWRAARGQYDLNVFQLGNSRLHEFIWPYLFQYPGLALLHDARLHHARGRALLRRGRAEDYRAEFAWNHADLAPALSELAVRGFNGPYYYQWPMTRALVEASRLTACHSRGAAQLLRDAYPAHRIEYVALGEGPAHPQVDAQGQAFRAAHGFGSDVIFGVHGGLTAAKRVPQILRAFAAVRSFIGPARLLLAGRADPALRLEAAIRDLGLSDTTTVVDALDDEAFDASVAACDVTLNLRWPTALETSGPWLRSLALGRPTVIFDLAHQPDLPTLDPRTWRRHAPCPDPSSEADARAMAVAIDVLDEDHSLRLAIRRLATDAPLRHRVGREAQRYWQREHTVERMVEDFVRACETAAAQPAPVVSLPAHLRPDPEAWAHTLLEPFQPGTVI